MVTSLLEFIIWANLLAKVQRLHLVANFRLTLENPGVSNDRPLHNDFLGIALGSGFVVVEIAVEIAISQVERHIVILAEATVKQHLRVPGRVRIASDVELYLIRL